MSYPKNRKEAVLKKMLPPINRSISVLAKEEGITEGTLYRWRNQARSEGRLMPDGDTTPQGWNASDKFSAVLECAAMNESELAHYCRERGLYPEQINQWREACEQANDWQQAQAKTLKQAAEKDCKRIRELEKDLKHTEKALAETAALLVLLKKDVSDLGQGRGRMISDLNRCEAVELINQAITAGATQAQACQSLGICARTYQRWTRSPTVKADARPSAIRPKPSNKLTQVERDQILAICNSPPYQSLPPSQIVPALADKGQYIASESSFYRVLKAANQAQRHGKARVPNVHVKPKACKAT